MTWAGGHGSDYTGFKDVFRAQPPWLRDTSIGHAFIADAINLNLNPSGFTRGGTSGASINSGGWSQTRGSTAADPFNCRWFNGFAGKGLGSVSCTSGSASNAFIRADSIGVAASGTAVPISIIVCAQFPVAPTDTNWCLFYFGRSSSSTPAFSAVGTAGTTDFGIARRNDAGNAVGGTTLSPGTNPFVLYVKYTGTTLTTRLNYVTKDNALAFNGGLLTTDQFAIGAQRSTVTNGFAKPSIYAWVDSIGSNMPDPIVNRIETYLCRIIGV